MVELGDDTVMGPFDDNPFGATPLDNASDVNPCEEDCKPLPDYSHCTLEQLQRVFTQRKRKRPRDRLALFTAIESRLNRPVREAKTWKAYREKYKRLIPTELLRRPTEIAEPYPLTYPTKAAFDATIWAVRSERAPLTKMLKTLYHEVLPHRVWVPGCRTLL